MIINVITLVIVTAVVIIIIVIIIIVIVNTQGLHSQILMTGEGEGGGVRQKFIFYTPKNHNFRICLPKKITTFFSIPKRYPLVLFSQPKKIPLFFCDPKKSRHLS